jgi:predicted dienelactone hydrolase
MVKEQRTHPKKLKILLSAVLWSAVTVFPSPCSAAQVVKFDFLGISFDISLKELQELSRTGQFAGEWSFVNGFTTPEQRQNIQSALTYTPPFRREAINSIFSSQYTPRFVLEQLSRIVRSESSVKSSTALKQAVLAANSTPGGLNAISFIEAFPAPTISVHLDTLIQLATQLKSVVERTQVVTAQVASQAVQLSQPSAPSLAPFAQPGPHQWISQSFAWRDRTRDNDPVPTNLLLPMGQTAQPLPLVVISHGLGEDQTTFQYLAEHLASHGYAVALPAHIQTDATALTNLLEGYSKPPSPTAAINRVQDISFILDQLEREPSTSKQINTQKVAVVGHSYGGFTALAVGGTVFDPGYNPQACDLQRSSTINISVFLQCSLMKLPQPRYELGDPRVGAIVAADAFTSLVFSPASLQSLRTPTLMLTGSADIVVPMVLEATPTYSQIGARDKYLVMLKGGTHFSVLPPIEGGIVTLPPALIGPSQTIGNRYFKALVLAFANAYINGDLKSRAALNQTGAVSLSDKEMPLAIINGPMAGGTTQGRNP